MQNEIGQTLNIFLSALLGACMLLGFTAFGRKLIGKSSILDPIAVAAGILIATYLYRLFNPGVFK